MNSPFNAYDKYMDMTTTLKKLIEEGKDESAEGEALRDAMDDVWFLMTPEEIKRFNPDNEIDSFDGDFRWLSNFWPSNVTLDAVEYPSVEHAYQAAKTTDATLRKSIANAKTPGLAKKMGKGLAMRSDWNSIKLDVMEHLLRQKFAVGSELSEKLLATGHRRLVEGNFWNDCFWGVCKGKGENHLGQLLMQIRKELQ